jgi:hydroxypyruvate isomerase
MKRRDFLAATPAAALLAGTAFAQTETPAAPAPSTAARFQLKYAPGLGAFPEHAGKDPLDALKFIADQGFRAYFDNGLMNKPVEEQEKIAREAQRLGLDVGPFVVGVGGSKLGFVGDDPAFREAAVEKMKAAVECAKRLNASCFLVVPSKHTDEIPVEQQTRNVVENLKACMGPIEPSGKAIVLEPLNPRNHPGMFLTRMDQAVAICRAVDSPSCKIVDDLYHQQITEGDLIPNIDKAWDYIGAFHLGDTPGRKEPTTGEINYRNVFKHIHSKGYEGVLCMEHGKSIKGKEGELALIAAYRWCDGF